MRLLYPAAVLLLWTAAKLVVTCKLFDDQIPVEGIRQTLEAVEGEHCLTERRPPA